MTLSSKLFDVGVTLQHFIILVSIVLKAGSETIESFETRLCWYAALTRTCNGKKSEVVLQIQSYCF